MVRKHIVLISMIVAFSMMASACKQQESDELISIEAQEESLKSDTMMADKTPEADTQEEAEFMDEEMKAFGERIKGAVAEKDMKALEVLLAYPTYIGSDSGSGKVINNTEEFMALSKETVFHKELMDTISAVDMSSLEITEAGVVMGNGTPNITFQVLEGSSFGITGIYE